MRRNKIGRAARRVALVACSYSKRTTALPVRHLYNGQLFRCAVRYAGATCDSWHVLSAKHHVLDPDDVVAPYDLCIGHLRRRSAQAATCTEKYLATQWAIHVRADLFCGESPRVRPGDTVVLLAGKAYREPLLPWMGGSVRIECPLEGLGIGRQMSWLNEAARAARREGKE